MQIQTINLQNRNINSNTNPNFKALKYSKKTLDQVCLTPKMLKKNKQLQKLSQIFDVTIVKGNRVDLLPPSLNKFINKKREDLTKKVLVSLGAGLATGTAASVLLGSPNLFILASIGLPTLTYLLGNIAIEKQEEASHSEPLFKVQLSKNEDFLEEMNLSELTGDEVLFRDSQEKICKEFIKYADWDYFVDIAQRTDEDGNTLAHLCSSENLNSMYEKVRFNSAVFTKVFTTPNKKGERAIHRLSDETIGRNWPIHIRLNDEEKKALLLEKPDGCGRSLAERWYEAQLDRSAIQMLSGYVGPKEANEIREKSIKYYDNFSVLSNTQIEKMIDNYFQKDKKGCPYYENLNVENFIRLARVLYESKNFDSLHSIMMHKDSKEQRMIKKLLDRDFVSIHKDLESFVGKENVEIINNEITSTKCEEIYNNLKEAFEETKRLPMLASKTRYMLSLVPERYKEVLLWEDESGENLIKQICVFKDFVQEFISTFKDKDLEFLKTILKTKIPKEFSGTSISTASYFSDSELKKDLEDILGVGYMFNEAQEKVLFDRRKSVLKNAVSFSDFKDKESLSEILSAFTKREDKKELFKLYLNPHQRQPLLDYYMDIDENMVLETFKAFYNYPEYLYKIITYSPNNILPVHTRFSKKLDEELIKIIGEEKFAELLPARKEYNNTHFIEDITKINVNKENAFHRVSDSETLVNMIQALKSDTNGKLEQALLQRDKEGLLPIHKILDDKGLVNVLIEQLQDKPNFLKTLLTSNAYDSKGYMIKTSLIADNRYKNDREFVSTIKYLLGEEFYNELKKEEEKDWQNYVNRLKKIQVNISSKELENQLRVIINRNPNDLIDILNTNISGSNLATTYYKQGLLSPFTLNSILQNEPEILSSIYFENNSQLLEAVIKNSDTAAISDLLKVLENNNDGLAKIYCAIKNTSSDVLNKDIKFLDELKQPLEPATKKVENYLKNINFYDPEEVRSFMKSSLVLDSDGEILNYTLDEKNEPILFSIADVKPTKENAEILQDIALVLKSLGKVNYSLVDGFGFNFLEKVLYMENEPLLYALFSKVWCYSPELDNCFADIKNEKFKNSAIKLRIEFPEIYQAVELKSINALEILEKQLKSSFYNREVQGAELWEIAKRHDRKFRTALCLQFKDYLPQKAQQELLEEA